MSERDIQEQSEEQLEDHAEALVLDYDLDASPDKVWRAISIPDLREAWLPGTDLADEQPVSTEAGRDVSYAIRENEPPFLESTVTFEVRPGEDGGTSLRVIHRLVGEQMAQHPPPAANCNRQIDGPVLMRAA